MSRRQPILIVLALLIAGCASGRAPAHPARASEVAPEVAASLPAPLPVVLFRLMVIRDWQSPYFIIETEDVDLTLPAALEMGIPAELWIRCAIENPAGFRQELYFVRKLRC